MHVVVVRVREPKGRKRPGRVLVLTGFIILSMTDSIHSSKYSKIGSKEKGSEGVGPALLFRVTSTPYSEAVDKVK
jgi:hypothetical protein